MWHNLRMRVMESAEELIKQYLPPIGSKLFEVCQDVLQGIKENSLDSLRAAWVW